MKKMINPYRTYRSTSAEYLTEKVKSPKLEKNLELTHEMLQNFKINPPL
jgi:hypothetical protein